MLTKSTLNYSININDNPERYLAININPSKTVSIRVINKNPETDKIFMTSKAIYIKAEHLSLLRDLLDKFIAENQEIINGPAQEPPARRARKPKKQYVRHNKTRKSKTNNNSSTEETSNNEADNKE